MPFSSLLLLVLGSIAGIYAAIVLLVRAFRTSLVWGLVSLFVPLGGLVFIIMHWEQGRKPFIAHLIGIALAVGGYCTLPKAMRPPMPGAQVAAHEQPSAAPTDRADRPEPRDALTNLNAEITKVQADGAWLQQEEISQTNNLTSVYNDLAARRAQLKPGDQAATAAFNRDAAAYTARKKQLETLREEERANDETLSNLLEKRTGLAAKTAADSPSVTVYGTQWCPACKMARQYLSAKGVPYRDVDVEHSPQGAAEFQQRGGGGVPLIVINGQQATGFNSAWVDAHLQ